MLIDIQKLQKVHKVGKQTSASLLSNMDLAATALYSFCEQQAISALIKILKYAEPTVEEINDFLDAIYDVDFKREMSQLLEQLKTNAADVKKSRPRKADGSKNGSGKCRRIGNERHNNNVSELHLAVHLGSSANGRFSSGQ